MRWWTADLHLGHANICAYTGRPYASVDDMNVALIERWNSRVADSDEVYVLGDLAVGHIGETLPLAELLCGSKVLVPEITTGAGTGCGVGRRTRWTAGGRSTRRSDSRSGPGR